MNTDNNNRFSPAAELLDAAKPYKHWCIPTLLYIVGMLIILLWAFCTRGCITENNGGGGGGSGYGVGDGTGSGKGKGSGKGGSGSGNGLQGKKAGKTSAPAAQGSGQKQASPGKTEELSESTKTDSSGKTGEAPDIEDIPADDNYKKLVYAPKNRPQRTQVQRAPKAATGGTTAGRKGFYGVKSKPGGKVIFLVDVSGSMAAPSRELYGKNRLDALKMQLKQSVFGGDVPTEENSKRSGGFIVMPFSSSVQRFPAKNIYRYRTAKDMSKAGDVINKLYCNGGTMMCQAWSKTLKVVESENINTVYFLTDGEPNDQFDAQYLKQQVRKKGIKKLTVHCISIGAERDFMKQIAKEYNGQYVYIP